MKINGKLLLLSVLSVIIFVLVLKLERLLSADSAYQPSMGGNDVVSASAPTETGRTVPMPGSAQSPESPRNIASSSDKPLPSDGNAVIPPENSEPAAPAPKVVASENPSPATTNQPEENILPDGFVYIRDVIPKAQLEIRYATDHNFTGHIVDGYESDRASLTREAALALKKAGDALEKAGYGIRIYDAYRPKRAVDSFVKWSEEPEDFNTKAEFYPDYDKKDLFSLGYIAKRSGHSRGSTVDLTIYYLNTGEDLDMGSPYDFLGPISNQGTDLISGEQTKNRNILKDAMKAAGFKEQKTEWWHFILINEPYPDKYFDFPVN